jgi:hypothetical protein
MLAHKIRQTPSGQKETRTPCHFDGEIGTCFQPKDFLLRSSRIPLEIGVSGWALSKQPEYPQHGRKPQNNPSE